MTFGHHLRMSQDFVNPEPRCTVSFIYHVVPMERMKMTTPLAQCVLKSCEMVGQVASILPSDTVT